MLLWVVQLFFIKTIEILIMTRLNDCFTSSILLVLGYAIVFCFCFFPLSLFSQDNNIDSIIALESYKPHLEYPPVREADVLWAKRVWRSIDTKATQNSLFANTTVPFMDIIHTAVLSGALSAYDNRLVNGDQFKLKLTIDEIYKLNIYPNIQQAPDVSHLIPDSLENGYASSKNKLTNYLIKEDWFFNTASSTMEVRIIGFAPVVSVLDKDGNYLGEEILYWLYYPDLRKVLTQFEAHYNQLDSLSISWADFFDARLFSSLIYKEENILDHTIKNYSSLTNSKAESDRIQKKIDDYHNFLWAY